MDQKAEIRIYIKNRTRLYICLKLIYNKLLRNYGSMPFPCALFKGGRKHLIVGNHVSNFLPILVGQ